MTPYQNRGGASGIAAYGTGPDSITVRFKDGHVYHYDNAVTGADNIVTMKQLATSGQGLNSFINTKVKSKYASKS